MASQETGGLNMTIEEYLYNPTEEVLELIGSLAGFEGLFLWR